ncbi:MAG: phosphoglucosamine mutase [Candidatus Woesearchaeota archaeon]
MRLFGTDGIRAKAGEYPLNDDSVRKLGEAFSGFLCQNDKKKVVVAISRDTRASGTVIEQALSDGFLKSADVMLLGVLPTNALSYSVRHYKADGGIMITASHNPSEDNGLKFFSSSGVKFNDAEEEEIEKLFFSGAGAKSEAPGKISEVNAKEDYISFLQKAAGGKLGGVKIVVDCANGAASAVAFEVFNRLGAGAVVINDKPDGTNINKNCGALFPEVVSQEVKKQNANLGLSLDGDADRAIFCDENGKILDGDQYMAIVASELNKKHLLKKSTLVATAYSNLALDEAMKKDGIKVVRVANGDRYVFEEMMKNGYNFGGEKSGHYIFLDYAQGGDGILSALQLLKIMKETGKKLSELATLKPYPQLMANVKVKEKKPLEQLELMRLAKALEAKIAGRVFIRYSGTENLLRIMAEGKNEKELKAAMAELEAQAKKELS